MALVRASDPQTSSVSSTSRYCRYHVFLSFRGQDTRKAFTDHLYTALVNAGFRTFRDDDEVERGEGIELELQKAIKHSRTSVIMFSKDYASSRWCLDELVMILERKRISADHVVLPVFYDVDPSDVRNQTGSLAKAFARHQKTQPSNKVKEWKEALAEVADLAGMVLPNQANGRESKFINKIVQVIGEKLRRRPLSVPHIMIGMQSRVNELNLWLQDGSDDVGILVIYGMSGIGKTTIAKSLYNTNFGRFEGSSFIENIREISQQPNGLVQIQKQLLSDILNGRKMKISSVSEGLIKIEDAISSKRVLLVLDDVDHIDQLDAVFQMKDRFYPRSKIIITTRRARLLKAHQVTKVYAVGTLTQKESLELFSWHAFGQDHPVEDYKEYSEKLVDHCGGLPLALKVLGSSLLGESVCLWKSALEKLEVIPNGEIINKLRVSYDCLQDDHDQKLFLHIACFFIGMDKDYIAKILDGCDFYTIVGIQNLIDRCLVIIDGWDKVQMHDLIRGMGREIVRLESKEPWKRSRVWHHKDSFKILTEKNGTETIEGLVLNMHMCPAINSNEKVLETNAFSRMRELKLLHLSHVQLDGSYAEFCTELRWLCWTKFPLDSIPVDFPLESVIILEMQYSGLRQVFKGTKVQVTTHWSVDVEMINLLGLCNLLESMAPIRMHKQRAIFQNDDPIPVQGLYEPGIFSTFFGGNKVPGKFSHKSTGSSISFTVPLLDNHRTRGLIVFVVYMNAGYDSPPIIHHNYLSQIIVKNKSNGLRGRYCPSRYGIPGEGEDMIWLSHWNLEDDQLQGGDEVVVSVIMKSGLLVKELGIQLVQVQEEENHNMMSISTDSSYHHQTWYNKRLGDSDEEDKREEVFSRFVCLPDEEEEQQDDITVATTTGSNNSGGLRGWKVLVTAACFFLTLTLITRSSPSLRKKQPSTNPG
ncbi:disease resistance protein RUN1-like [Prunus dulcis]|uniref:disease resistance protein RUN1-like n=1 Tax=Prunus dulcis TaxID=3755 RepID=UPI001481E712|nr:disease resistance protein RUN1-like [Prunus dulcis]